MFRLLPPRLFDAIHADTLRYAVVAAAAIRALLLCRRCFSLLRFFDIFLRARR